MNTTVSIIMPVYGVEKYIAKAIRSVQSQTYPDWELIVVNDGTKDRSRTIAAEFAAADKRIKIVDKENGGLSDARNVGLRHASGDYVNFFDSDDWLEPDFLQKMKDTVDENDSDFAVCGYFVDFIDNEGNLTGRSSRDDIPCKAASSSEFINLMENYINFAWNKLYKYKFLRANRLLFEKGLSVIEDCEFISRVLKCNPKICFTDYCGYHYVQRKEATLSSKFDSRIIKLVCRKLTLYQPVFSSLGASQRLNDEVFGNVRVNNLVYLFRIMAKSLDYVSFRSEIGLLYENEMLNPKKIRLKNCKSKAEMAVLLLAKTKWYRLIYFCSKR